MPVESGTSLIDQGKIISSSPGLDIVELPVNRYMFGEFNMRRAADRIRFDQEATGEQKLEYRMQLQAEELGIGPKQIIWVSKFPSWEFSLRKPKGEVVLVEFQEEELKVA